MHRARPPAPRFLLRRPPGPCFAFPLPLRGFSAPSPRRQPTSTKTRLTAPMSRQKNSRLSPLTQKQLSAARVGQVGSRDLPLCFVWRARLLRGAKRHREIALVRSPRAGRRIRLLAVSQESARAPWAVAIRPRTGRGPNDARDFFLSNAKHEFELTVSSIHSMTARRKIVIQPRVGRDDAIRKSDSSGGPTSNR